MTDRVTDTGQTRVRIIVIGAGYPIAVGLVDRNGLYVYTADNRLGVYDATAGLPSDTYRLSGQVFTPDGFLGISTDAPLATDQRFQGIAIREDGAVYCTADAVAPTSLPISMGRYTNPDGAIHIFNG